MPLFLPRLTCRLSHITRPRALYQLLYSCLLSTPHPIMTTADSPSVPPPLKRQKREEYRKAHLEAANEVLGGEVQGDKEIKMPKKKFYRQRAHANPFSDHRLDYPISPAHMDWASHFPAYVDKDPTKTNLSGAKKLVKDVEVVDIGCGFGGLLIGLAGILPNALMVGIEIRPQVLEYVTSRIRALRSQQEKLKAACTNTHTPTPSQSEPIEDPKEHTTANDNNSDMNQSDMSPVEGGYQNISALRSNTMKFLPNFFARHQLSKIFICFPDPHFKARKHKARIISETLNAEYAYVLRPGGLLYTITDVEEYHHWVLKHFKQASTSEDGEDNDGASDTATTGEAGGTETDNNEGQQTGIGELWERVTEEELEKDPCVKVMMEGTEEGKKVTRNKGNKYVAVFRRKADPEWP